MLLRLFGGSGESRNDAPKNAIVRLQEQLNTCDKRQTFAMKKIDDQEAIARNNASSNKRGSTLDKSKQTLIL